jgi:hypothetical protein
MASPTHNTSVQLCFQYLLAIETVWIQQLSVSQAALPIRVWLLQNSRNHQALRQFPIHNLCRTEILLFPSETEKNLFK